MPNNYENAMKRATLKKHRCIEQRTEPGTATFPGHKRYETGKIRVVHDAAAKTKGVSLNDHLLTGPDLLQLPGVIMRFRQHPVAVSADISEMFMQIKIKPEDRDALRYLWRGDKEEMKTY
ncbi:hypothetical protein EVAR_99671_1 [Eumeta japonica]|uniref:Reverse transcriptase domain-containing protein n=1 Tax=Eumeta variegata TaxID=151549 RepID=A0A4C2A3F2_EUMVA|nr:hypothetical protein EVAR_99671_1 [Eumeta japonica]